MKKYFLPIAFLFLSLPALAAQYVINDFTVSSGADLICGWDDSALNGECFTVGDGLQTSALDLSAKTQMSVTADSSGLKLSGDQSTPGNTKYYGTDGSGVKGWYSSLPATTPGGSDTQIQYNNAGSFAGAMIDYSFNGVDTISLTAESGNTIEIASDTGFVLSAISGADATFCAATPGILSQFTTTSMSFTSSGAIVTSGASVRTLSGDLTYKYQGPGSFVGSMDYSSLSDDRNYILQDGDGTLAFLSDISALSSIYQPLDSDLTALAGNTSNGIWARTGSGTGSARTITGTSNRIGVTNGDGVSGNPTIDISSSYVGQNTITTLGTVTTGVWNGTDVAFANIAQLGANTVATNPTTGTADISSTALSTTRLLGRGSANITAITTGDDLVWSGNSFNVDETAKYGWSGQHSFLDSLVTFRNPANTFGYLLAGSAIVANRTVTLPLLAANDTFVFANFAQTLDAKTLTGVANATFATGAGIRTATSAGNTLLLQAYDVDGAAYTTFGTLTANNTPTLAFSGVSIDGSIIGGATPAAANFGGSTNYASFSSAGNLIFNGASQYVVNLDQYAFAVNTLPTTGIEFQFFSGIPGYNHTDTSGATIANIEVSGNESFVHGVYGFSSQLATPTQLAANTNNWALIANNAGQFYRISSDAARNVTGIVAPTNSSHAVSKRLVNIGAFNISFTYEDAASTAANRLITSSAGTIVLPPNGQLDIWYDYTSSRWRISLMN